MISKYFKGGKNKLSRHKTVLVNFSWMTVLEVFMLLAPLITYPYLVRVLGMELYGLILTAQVLTSYATIIIDFGSNIVLTKHVSINRNNKEMLSEIVSSVLIVRSFLWLICIPIYCAVFVFVPMYREWWPLFLITYGMTLNDVLFPLYFFQGIEKMRISSIMNISIKLFFIIFVFILVRRPKDYLLVPALYTIGYALVGVTSMYLIFVKMDINLKCPPIKRMMIYVKDSSSIFATDIICTIKDKLNYFLLGGFSGMANVVVYDLGLKINTLIGKPAQIVSQVFMPRFAKTKNEKKLRIMTWYVFGVTLLFIIIINMFLPSIVGLFINTHIDLIPLRIYSLSPLFFSVSVFLANNFFIAFGYNRYLLYCILITSVSYLMALGIVFITNQMASVYSFISISLFSYMIEFLYRIIMKIRLVRNRK